METLSSQQINWRRQSSQRPIHAGDYRCLALIVVILLALAQEEQRYLMLYSCSLVDQIPLAPEKLLLGYNNNTLVNFAGYIRYKQVSPEGLTLDTKFLRIRPFFVGHLDRMQMSQSGTTSSDYIWIVFFCGSIGLRFSRLLNGTLIGATHQHEVQTLVNSRKQEYHFEWDLNLSESKHYECRGTMAIPLIAYPYRDAFVDKYNEITLIIEEFDWQWVDEITGDGNGFSKPIQDCGHKTKIIPHQHHYLVPRDKSRIFEGPEKFLLTNVDEFLFAQLRDKLPSKPSKRKYKRVPSSQINIKGFR